MAYQRLLLKEFLDMQVEEKRQRNHTDRVRNLASEISVIKKDLNDTSEYRKRERLREAEMRVMENSIVQEGMQT